MKPALGFSRLKHTCAESTAPDASTRCTAGVSPIAVIPTNPILPARRRVSNAGQDALENLLRSGLAVSARGAHRVVELEEIDPIPPEPPEARLERARHRLRRVGEPVRAQAHLRRHEALAPRDAWRVSPRCSSDTPSP